MVPDESLTDPPAGRRRLANRLAGPEPPRHSGDIWVMTLTVRGGSFPRRIGDGFCSLTSSRRFLSMRG